MWFQVILEIALFIGAIELVLRAFTKQGIVGAIKGLMPTAVQDAIADVVEHPHMPDHNDDRIAELRRQVSIANDEVRIAEEEGKATEALAAARRRLATARGMLTKATRVRPDSPSGDTSRS